MPYTTLKWREGKGAESALAGMTAYGAANPGYTTSGDYIELKKGFGQPTVVGFGAHSITKALGSALSGNRSRSQERWVGPGSSNNWPNHGWAKDLRLGFQQGEQVTAWSCIGADEMGIVAADVVYTAPHDAPKTINEAVRMGGGYSEVFSVDSSLTTTSGSFTNADGQEAIDTTTTQDLWLDSDAEYAILGVQPCIGLLNGGGLLQVTSLGEAWSGHNPCIKLPEQSGVTFEPGAPSFAYEPIPFLGDQLPQLAIMSATSGAHLFGLLIGKK